MANHKKEKRRRTKENTIKDLKESKNKKNKKRSTNNEVSVGSKVTRKRNRKSENKKPRFKDKHPKLSIFIKIMIIFGKLISKIKRTLIYGFVRN